MLTLAGAFPFRIMCFRIHPQEPAGGILSNGLDMSRWLHLLLNKGRTDEGAQIVNSTLIEDTMTSWMEVDPEFTKSPVSLWKPEFPVQQVFAGFVFGWFIT
jgi:CubicO group peptidase (beta-lactamase class C family)